MSTKVSYPTLALVVGLMIGSFAVARAAEEERAPGASTDQQADDGAEPAAGVNEDEVLLSALSDALEAGRTSADESRRLIDVVVDVAHGRTFGDDEKLFVVALVVKYGLAGGDPLWAALEEKTLSKNGQLVLLRVFDQIIQINVAAIELCDGAAREMAALASETMGPPPHDETDSAPKHAPYGVMAMNLRELQRQLRFIIDTLDRGS